MKSFYLFEVAVDCHPKRNEDHRSEDPKGDFEDVRLLLRRLVIVKEGRPVLPVQTTLLAVDDPAPVCGLNGITDRHRVAELVGCWMGKIEAPLGKDGALRLELHGHPLTLRPGVGRGEHEGEGEEEEDGDGLQAPHLGRQEEELEKRKETIE